MTASVCPRCGSSLSGAETHVGGTVVCPICAETIPYPPDIDPPAAGEPEPWTEDSLEGAISLPFNPRQEPPGVASPARGRRAMLWSLAGAAAFLAAMIGAVLLARHLRPMVAGSRTMSQASLQPVVARLQAGTQESRLEAAQTIVAMGPQALAATLDQIAPEDRANDKFSIAPGAVRALAAASDQSVATISEALRSSRPGVRAAAASVLREMGERGHEALDPLTVALHDENRWVRCIAAEALGNLGSHAEPAVPALLGLIDHPDAYTRRRAIDALGHIGPAARSAAAPLAKAEEQDPDAAVRRAAYLAIRQVRLAEIAQESLEEADKEVQGMVAALQGDDEPAGVAAAKALGAMGIKAKDAVPALALALKQKEKWRREAAAKALGNLGIFAGDFVPALQTAAKDAEPEVRAAAEKALEEIEGTPGKR